MKLRCLATLMVLAFSTSALAHDPALHEEPAPADKPKPTTCAQVADAEHHDVDMKDPAVKALKERCDAEKKAGG